MAREDIRIDSRAILLIHHSARAKLQCNPCSFTRSSYFCTYELRMPLAALPPIMLGA